MIRSMTGFGTASGAVGGRRLAVELRSVNHRFFTAGIRLTPDLSRFEWEVRELLKKGVVRGHVTLVARYETTDGERVAIDEKRFTAYVALLRDLKQRHVLGGEIDLATLLRLPDILGGGEEPEESDGSDLVAVCRAALDDHTRSRESEGTRLVAYLHERLDHIAAALDRIGARAPERVVAHRERLKTAVAELTEGVQVDPARIAMEVALLAERLDIGEEVSRFQSHIVAFRQTLLAGGDEVVGKRLGFLLQEMLREANTTGSKANDIALTEDVVRIKEELERLREQVENLE